MNLSIATNIASLTAQNNLASNSKGLETAVARLSSGLRINRAADDAAGLAISEGLKSQIRGLTVVERNASDGISMLQTAEGVLNSVHSILSRLRELALQSANGTYGTAERSYMNDEFQRLIEEIDRIANTTEFNGKQLLDGSFSAGVGFQVGLNSVADDRIIVSIPSARASNIGLNGGSYLASQAVGTVTAALQSLGSIDVAISDTSRIRGQLGAAQNRFEHTINNIQIMRTNVTAANSRIRDADIAAEASVLARASVLTQASSAMLAQANQLPQIALQLLQ